MAGVKIVFRYFMVFVLFVISIGGLFYPYIGLLVPVFMAFLLTLSFFRGRYWCAHICPRGSFLDYLIKPVSKKGKIPKLLLAKSFSHVVLFVFMVLLGLRIYSIASSFSGWVLLSKLGFIFASVCLVTTVISVFLGLLYSHRTWCVFCPMGLMQKTVYYVGRHFKR